MKKVTLNISDFRCHWELNCLFDQGHADYDILCEILANGVKIGEFSADGIPAAVGLEAIVNDKYEQDEDNYKELRSFDKDYINDACYDYIENSETCEILDAYKEAILERFKDEFGDEFEVENVTCKSPKEFGFRYYGRQYGGRIS